MELANAQSERHDVTMILHRRAAEDRPNAIAHRLDARVRQVLVGGWRFFAVRSARRALCALAPDVAHAHLSSGCRVLHGLRGHCLRVATLHIEYKKQQHRDMDALIAIAPWQLNGVPAEQRPHTVQIDNWVQCQPAAADARARLRQTYGLCESDYVIGALGRTEASKGLDELLDAFGAAALGERVRLVIVGHGRHWQDLRRRAPPSVVMPGFVARPQDWFACFDAFVSAARSEPFGLVFLEAMAAGLPVLATASQGGEHLRELIERPLLPLRDVGVLTSALRQLALQRPPRKSYDLSAYSYLEKVAAVEQFYSREIFELAGRAAQPGAAKLDFDADADT